MKHFCERNIGLLDGLIDEELKLGKATAFAFSGRILGDFLYCGWSHLTARRQLETFQQRFSLILIMALRIVV